MANEKRNSAEHLAVGGGLLTAGATARGLIDHDARKRKMDGPLKSLMSGSFTRRHAGHTAGRMASRAAVATGVPLAAYGAYTALRPKKMAARKLNYKSDVVDQITHKLTYQDVAEKVLHAPTPKKHAIQVHGRDVAKRALTSAETNTLVHRKERGRKISTAAGVMGLTALALRAPEAAKFAAAKSPAVARRVGRLARREPGATRASNALGIVSIGTGSAGSLNYAAQQKLEAQQVKKRDDRFLREHRDRISPKAEEGYRYLRRGRNAHAADAAVSGGFAGLSAGLGAQALRQGSKGWAAVGGASAALSAVSAARSGKKAARWNSKMGKIKAKGVERAAAGEYGQGRVVAKRNRDVVEAGAGGGLIVAGVKGGRLFDAASSRATTMIDSKHRERVKPLRSVIPIDEMGRKNPPLPNSRGSSFLNTRPNPDKAGSKAERKAAGGKVAALNGQRNRSLRRVARATGFKPRAAFMSAAMMGGTGLAWHGSRNAVRKRLDSHDVDAGMAGGLIGAAGYQGAMYATKPLDRKYERMFAQEGSGAREVLAEHRRRTGVSSATPKGDAKWLKYHRTFPMELPGAKFKRRMSYAHAGKTGVALTAAAAATGAAVGIKGNREARRSKFGKALLVPRVRVPGGSLMRKPSIKRSFVNTSATGRKFTVRGSIG